jgi:hypothetical protein
VAIQGPLKVEFGDVFPHGAFLVGAVEPVRDFEASSAGSPVQGRDKTSGLPLWQVDVLDADPEARERTLRVKIAASVQPVPPDALAGLPFRPVELDGLTVTPYVKESGQGRAGSATRCARPGCGRPSPPVRRMRPPPRRSRRRRTWLAQRRRCAGSASV